MRLSGKITLPADSREMLLVNLGTGLHGINADVLTDAFEAEMAQVLLASDDRADPAHDEDEDVLEIDADFDSGLDTAEPPPDIQPVQDGGISLESPPARNLDGQSRKLNAPLEVGLFPADAFRALEREVARLSDGVRALLEEIRLNNNDRSPQDMQTTLPPVVGGNQKEDDFLSYD